MKPPLVSETNWDTCSDNIERHKDWQHAMV